MAKVLIVDDSVLMRAVIRDMLQKDPSITVAGTAANGVTALEKIKALRPDLITLDIEMPEMNGLELLEKLRDVQPRPKVLILSSLTPRDAEVTDEAIRLGADDFMLKPQDTPNLRDIADELNAKIRHLLTLVPAVKAPAQKGVLPWPAAQRLVLIGSSAGGPPMVDALLSRLPAGLPAGIIITQHMPAGFTAPLAVRFDRIARMRVKETENGDVLESGRVYVSKAGYHTIVSAAITEDGSRTGKIVHSQTPPLHGVRPAIDKTFESAAQVFGRNIVSVILSGMGDDAGGGASAIKRAGGVSLVCEEKDCLVYGMARSAISRNAVDQILPLENLAEAIEQAVLQMERSHV